MRTFACAIVLALVAPALAADKPADVSLPFNPADAGAPATGEWARFRLVDPNSPDESLPPELYTVKSVDAERVVVEAGQKKQHHYRRGDAGKSALAFLAGFFGEEGRMQLDALRSVSVTPDPIEVMGKKWDGAVRIDAVTVISLARSGSAGATGTAEMRATFQIWVAPGVKAAGILKATAAIEISGDKSGGTLTLDAQGTAAEKPFEEKAEAPPEKK